jgi:alanine racemase
VYSIQNICSVVEGAFISQSSDDTIGHLIYDSRRIQQPSASIFFALKTSHNDGHKYIADAYKKGVRNFIVSEQIDQKNISDANIIFVNNTLLETIFNSRSLASRAATARPL